MGEVIGTGILGAFAFYPFMRWFYGLEAVSPFYYIPFYTPSAVVGGLMGVILSGLTIKTKEDMVTAAKKIGDDYHCAVLLKGGHRINDANDLLYTNGEVIWFEEKRIDNPNTHGTGCTLSSAIASNLAKGFTLDDY